MTLDSMILEPKTYVLRWRELLHDRQKNDLGIAKLARDIRAVLPRGSAGDEQFRDFVKHHLENARSDVMLIKAKSFAIFTEVDWPRYGGWPGIGLLIRLEKGERRQVRSTLAENGPGPYSYSTILKCVHGLGIEPENNGIGRPPRVVAEQKAQMLGAYLQQLYASRPDLPQMPESVKRLLPNWQPMSSPAPRAGARA